MEFRKNKSEIKIQEHQKSIIDMDPILKRIPPIEGVFSPNEEVEKLWSVPKRERRKAVALFRDKLVRQGEAWMLCRTSIEKQIEANPDLSREEMVGIINEFASHYGFAEKDINVAESLIDDYMEMHKRVVEIRKEFPDDIALINRLTGRKFSKSDAKDFKVSVGPMSIEILCSEFNASRIYKKSEKPEIWFKYGGFASQSDDEKPIYYLVINNDYPTKNPNYYDATTVLEREHLKNKILASKLYGIKEIHNAGEKLVGKKLLNFGRIFDDELLQKYESMKDPEKKALLLAEYMRLKREDAFNSAKDEIVAMKKAESNHKLYDYNIFLKKPGDSYDYLRRVKNVGVIKDDSLWQEIAQKILVDEYGKIINDAIYAFDNLRSNGYSLEEVIAILSDKRLPEWPKTVRRLLEQKKEDK